MCLVSIGATVKYDHPYLVSNYSTSGHTASGSETALIWKPMTYALFVCGEINQIT